MNKESILSICIPTYNRAECLDQILAKMLPVCVENDIQICISDNASPDHTEEVGKSYALKYENVHYYRHPENIGSDNNFEYVLKMADTKYRWLMSDTCYVDHLVDLMQDLSSTDWDGYVVNGDSFRAAQLPHEKIRYDNSIYVMNDIGWHLTWISCMIYNERLINSMNFERYKDSSFNQTALMFEPTANRSSQICFNPSIIVGNLSTVKDSGWLYHVFDVMYRQWYLLIMSLPLYYPYEVKKKCVVDAAHKPILLSTRRHFIRRLEGKWSFKDVYRNRFFIRQSQTGCLVLMMMGACPLPLIKFIFFLVHQVKNVIRLIWKNC